MASLSALDSSPAVRVHSTQQRGTGRGRRVGPPSAPDLLCGGVGVGGESGVTRARALLTWPARVLRGSWPKQNQTLSHSARPAPATPGGDGGDRRRGFNCVLWRVKHFHWTTGSRAAGRARAAEVMATYVPMYSASSSLAAAPGARGDPSFFDKRKISKKKQAKNGQKY